MLRDTLGRFTRGDSHWEALLRQRLRPEQLADLDKTGAFNVRGGRGKGYLYRIRVTKCSNNMARVTDRQGYSRNFWFYHLDRADNWDVMQDPYEHALALMTIIQGNVGEFERKACSGYFGDPPTDYGGAI